MATYESTIVASLFAATYPERTRSLILIDPQVTYLPTEETPWMPSPARWQEQIQAVRDTWGTLDWWDAPAGPEREWFARYARSSVTPGGLAAELTRYLHTDIRAVLPTIQVPTLVLVDSDRFYEVLPETGHFVARKIPGARVIEHSSRGGPHFHWYARSEAIVAEVRRFLAGSGRERRSTALWRQYLHRIVDARPPPTRATEDGATWEEAPRDGASRSPLSGIEMIRRATAFSPRRRAGTAPSAVPWRITAASGARDRGARGMLPARWSEWGTRSEGSPQIALAWEPWPFRRRCSSPDRTRLMVGSGLTLATVARTSSGAAARVGVYAARRDWGPIAHPAGGCSGSSGRGVGSYAVFSAQTLVVRPVRRAHAVACRTQSFRDANHG